MRLRAMAAVAGLTLLASTRATAASFEEEFPRRVVEELRRRNPALVDTLTLADSASAQNRYQDAAALYARIRTAEPRFSHAWRREGYELMRSGLRPDAIARMRTAISLEDSCWNQYGLAAALFYTPSTQEPTPAEVDEAESLIRRSEIQRELPEAAQLGCLIAMRTGDKPWLDDQSERFVRLAPSNPVAHAFRAAHLTATGDRSRARSELLRARQLGLDEDTYRHLLDATAETPFHHIVRIGAWTLAIWVAGLVLLLGVGHALSEATLRTSKRLPSQAGGQATGADAGLRQTYRAVLTACCAYYYISLPIVLASVLLVGGGLVYLLLETGHIPVKLVLIIAVLTLVTLWSVVKSIFLRSHDEDPGLPLEAGTYPRLRKVLDEVASRIETRPVTNVYLTPGTECAVMERGGMGRQIRGQTERCLILGVGMLEGWKLRPFRAVLAHEYGHFSNRDTAGGGFALAVRRSLVTTAIHLAQGGAAAWYNPAWLFVNGFHAIFLRISQGASRLQEVLADRWAAFGYGSRAFADGLRHVVERSVRFDAHANHVLREVIEAEGSMTNLYRHAPQTPLDAEGMDEAIRQQMNREPSPYDSHPRPVDRIEWVLALAAEGVPPQPDDQDEVWSLFEDREDLERRLTDEIRRHVADQHGATIPKGPAEPTPASV